jgi:enoyl-CoA hydratase/carnithine racemase
MRNPMSFASLIFEKSKGVATITLNRPETLNAQTRASLAELNAAFEDAGEDESIGVVILRGAGRAFCAGMDLRTSFGQQGMTQLEKEGGEGVRFGVVCDTMENISKPIIAAVQGFAVTGGFLLAYTADLLIAAENAQFIDTHARWGLVPGAGESQRLPRRVGLAKAKELFFTCEQIGAVEAHQLGLVNRVVPPEKLDEEARRLADKILANSRASIGVLKALVNKGARASFEAGMKQELEAAKGGMANMEPNSDRDARLRAFEERARPK